MIRVLDFVFIFLFLATAAALVAALTQAKVRMPPSTQVSYLIEPDQTCLGKEVVVEAIARGQKVLKKTCQLTVETIGTR